MKHWHIAIAIYALFWQGAIAFTLDKKFIEEKTPTRKKDYIYSNKKKDAKEIGTVFSGKVWVIDGDSLKVTLADNSRKEVRLFGIDAPEFSTKAGKKAKAFIIKHFKKVGRSARCTIKYKDIYGRYVSTCYDNANNDVAEVMLESGHARVYRYFIKRAPKELKKRYFSAEKKGQERKKSKR